MSLSETSELIRKFARWSVLAIIGLILLRILWSGGLYVWEAVKPNPPPKPTVPFGQLPKISLPPSLVNLYNVNLSLETVSGRFPKLPPILPVYVVPQPQPNILNTDNAKKVAASFGFKNEPQIVSKTDYRWQDPSLPYEKFRIDPISGNFEYHYDFQANSSVLETSSANKLTLLDLESAVIQAKNFLSQRVSLPKDLQEASVSAKYVSISKNLEKEVNSPSEANAIRLEFFRSKLQYSGQEYPIVTPNPEAALVRALISMGEKRKILSVNYTYWPIESAETNTYPIRTPEQAWNDLLNNQGVVVQVQNPNIISATIQNISLAYFDDGNLQNYLQPIYVFSGQGFTQDNRVSSFTIYLPAVTSEYIVQE